MPPLDFRRFFDTVFQIVPYFPKSPRRAPARAYGSQGQQRSLVLALKLAEADVLEQEGGEAPVILLDDVMSELDAGRQHYLLNRLDGRQVFLTCCEPGAVKRLEEGALFEVRRGELYVPTSGAGHGD